MLAFAVRRIGVHTIMQQLASLGSAVVVIVCLSWVRMFLQTRAWSTALQQDGIQAPNTELFFLRLASQGIGYLTVLGPAASEPMKIRLLQSYGGSATAATLVDTGVYWLSAGVVLILEAESDGPATIDDLTGYRGEAAHGLSTRAADL